MHLLLLTGLILALTASAHYQALSKSWHPQVSNVSSLPRRVGIQILVFGVVFRLAQLCSKATKAQWRLSWRGGMRPVWLGLAYSVVIRVAVLVLVMAFFGILGALHLLTPELISRMRPQVENAVSTRALATDPLFLWMTLLLCGSAGLLEEIWRGGMLAGLAGVVPGVFGGRLGPWFAIFPVAVLFGVGHLYMGWTAAAVAAVVGILLGAIMVLRDSIWEAVIAHAAFDAMSLALLAWITLYHAGPKLG